MNDGKWWAGEIKGSKFRIFKKQIPTYKAKAKTAKTEKKMKAFKAAIRRANKTQRDCAAFGANPEAIKPVANPAAFTGSGIDAVAITMSGDSKLSGIGYTCVLITPPNNATVSNFSEQQCNALVKPTSHRSGDVVLQFAIRRLTDNVQSDPATITVSYSQDGELSGDYHSLARYKSSLTELEAARLARWYGLGKDMELAMQIGQGENGLDALVDHLLSGDDSPECAAVEAQAQVIADTQRHSWGAWFGPTGQQAVYYTGNLYWSTAGFQNYLLHMMRYGCEPTRERAAHYLLNHFPVNLDLFSWGSSREHYLKDYLDIIRSRGAHDQGKLFNSFEYTVSKQHGEAGSMLVYLNNRFNYRNGNQFGNEDYSRETLELFTLGPRDAVTDAENYNEDNVFQLGFALMGYTEADDPDGRGFEMMNCSYHPVWNPNCGTNGWPTTLSNVPVPKTNNLFDDLRWNNPQNPDPSYLFQQFPFGRYDVFKANTFDAGEDNVTPYLMYSHPGVARYIAGRLFTHLAGLELTEEIVAPLAAMLSAAQFDPIGVLKEILSSSSYFSPEASGDCIADPLEVTVSMLRALDLPIVRVQPPGVTWYYDLYWRVRQITNTGGFFYGRPDSIFGWRSCGKRTGSKVHNGEMFVSAQPLLERQRHFAWYLNDLNGVIDSVPSSVNNMNWQTLLPAEPALQRNPEAIINHLARKLALVLTPEEMEYLVEYMTTLVFTTKIEQGQTVPDLTLVVNWNDLSELQFGRIVKLKIPGVLEILHQLTDNNFR